MESEVIALAHSFLEFFHIVDMAENNTEVVGLTIWDTNMNISNHGDNYGALALADDLPPQFTPHINYYDFKTIW